MKKIAKIVSVFFIVGGLVLIFGERAWFPDFYNPIFMGLMGLVSVFLIYLPRLFLETKNQQQEKVLDMIQIGIVFGLVIGAVGSLGLFQLYKIGVQYDKIVHFLNSFIFTAILIRSFEVWRGFSLVKSVLLSAIIVFFGGVVWEIYEFFGDNLFGTQMLGQYGQLVTEDTVWDMIVNWFGIILAVIGIKIFKK